MLVIAFLDVLGGKFDFADLSISSLAGQRADLELAALDCDDIEIIQVNGVARVSDDRAHVAGEKIFFLANTEHERASSTRADNEIRNLGVNQRNAVGADDLPQRSPHSVNQARFLLIDINRGGARIDIKFSDQMREHFGISVRAKIIVAVLN